MYKNNCGISLKKKICPIIAVILLMAVITATLFVYPLHSSAFLEKDYQCETIVGDSSSCKITGYNGNDEHVEIPETLCGLKVVEIGKCVFADKTFIKSIKLPNTLKTLGNSAFYGCSNIETITIPDLVCEIPDSCFANCLNLMSIYVGESTTFIGINTFFNCPKLEDINVSPNNKTYKSVDGVLLSFDGKTLIRFPEGKSICNNLPNSIETVSKASFSNCKKLTEVIFPYCVKTLKDNLFQGCTNLKRIFIPESVVSISRNALKDNNDAIIVCAKDSCAYKHACLKGYKIETPNTLSSNNISVTSSTVDNFQQSCKLNCTENNIADNRNLYSLSVENFNSQDNLVIEIPINNISKSDEYCVFKKVNDYNITELKSHIINNEIVFESELPNEFIVVKKLNLIDGDANCDGIVGSDDFEIIKKVSCGENKASPYILNYCDVNNDGVVDGFDGVKIACKYAK